MNLICKFRQGYDRQVTASDTGLSRKPASADRPGSVSAARGGRLSNGLKDFLWHLDGVKHGNLLDLGPVWQATVTFFIERGFKVHTEDVIRAWKDFLHTEMERMCALPPGQDAPEMSLAARAERFLSANLQYPSETFDAVLAWDLLDYLDDELVTRVVNRLTELLKRGGVVLAVFHNRKPESFHRYRVLDGQTLELLPAPVLCPTQRTYQNREILNLFGHFHSSKTFVGRDQLREGVLVK